jgi:hypothetical protein
LVSAVPSSAAAGKADVEAAVAFGQRARRRVPDLHAGAKVLEAVSRPVFFHPLHLAVTKHTEISHMYVQIAWKQGVKRLEHVMYYIVKSIGYITMEEISCAALPIFYNYVRP